MNKNRKAFTLIELIIVVIIIGILSSIALPKYGKAVEKSRISGALSVLDSIRSAQFRYATEYNSYANNLSSLDAAISASDKFFTFFANGSADPFQNPSETLGSALRNSNSSGTYDSGYRIEIREDGYFYSNNSQVNKVLQ